jgi:hypothetical protein
MHTISPRLASLVENTVGQDDAKYLIVVTHVGHTVEQGFREAMDIFQDDAHAKYVYFLDGFGYSRNAKFIQGPVDFTNVTDVQEHFPGAF